MFERGAALWVELKKKQMAAAKVGENAEAVGSMRPNEQLTRHTSRQMRARPLSELPRKTLMGIKPPRDTTHSFSLSDEGKQLERVSAKLLPNCKEKGSSNYASCLVIFECAKSL